MIVTWWMFVQTLFMMTWPFFSPKYEEYYEEVEEEEEEEETDRAV